MKSDVETVRRRLLAQGFPRFEMLLLISLAGFAAFLTSAALLSAGLESMAARYALAAAAAYLFFLALVRVWISLQRRRWPVEPEIPLPGGGSAGDAQPLRGGGGSFGGGGASGSFGSPDADAGSGLLGAVPDDLEAWPLAVVAGIALVAVGALIAVGLVIWASPVLFAEVLLDAAVVGAVYRRARTRNRGHWLQGVLRRTWLAALGLGLLVAAVGFALQLAFPEARSIGGVLGR